MNWVILGLSWPVQAGHPVIGEYRWTRKRVGWLDRPPSRTMTVGEILATRFPICAKPERLSASRPCAVRAAQLRHGARVGRAAAAADRGHRRNPLPAGIRDGDLRRSRMARHRMGKAGAPAIGASWRIPGGAGRTCGEAAHLSKLREP